MKESETSVVAPSTQQSHAGPASIWEELPAQQLSRQVASVYHCASVAHTVMLGTTALIVWYVVLSCCLLQQGWLLQNSLVRGRLSSQDQLPSLRPPEVRTTLSLSAFNKSAVWGWLEPGSRVLPHVLLKGTGVAIGRGREAFEARKQARCLSDRVGRGLQTNVQVLCRLGAFHNLGV